MSESLMVVTYNIGFWPFRRQYLSQWNRQAGHFHPSRLSYLVRLKSSYTLGGNQVFDHVTAEIGGSAAVWVTANGYVEISENRIHTMVRTLLFIWAMTTFRIIIVRFIQLGLLSLDSRSRTKHDISLGPLILTSFSLWSALENSVRD